MTAEEAVREAEKRYAVGAWVSEETLKVWTLDGGGIPHVGGTCRRHVGLYTQLDYRQILGSGNTWEEAFEQADKRWRTYRGMDA